MQQLMRLKELVDSLPAVQQTSGDDDQWDASISAIVADSRRVQPGALFVAYEGVSLDGHDFLDQAVANGAAAIVGERSLADISPQLRWQTGLAGLPLPYVQVRDGREALAYLHAAWYAHPARRLTMIGVTGTDGKTTVVNLIAAVLRAAGRRVGMVCTISADIDGRQYETGLHTTTPDAPEVQAYLAEMVAAGVEYGVVEATSHGLAQHRVTGCDFDVAVVTNITHEHLDFHSTLEGYLAAKFRLFANLTDGYRKPGVPKVAVLNRDDSSFDYLAQAPADLQLDYGLSEEAAVRVVDVVYGSEGTRFEVQATLPQSGSDRISFELKTPLVGEFNVYNCLAATAVTLSQDIGIDDIQRGVASMRGVSGRMERIDEGQDFLAIVDFAHTPGALQAALATARQMADGRVIVVFGCAGLRDVDKRAWMGRIAGQLADRVVITAEDPRTESLDHIMSEIAGGCEEAGCREGQEYWRVGDRGDAISFAVQMAEAGDAVIVTGKGHERSMCFGVIEQPWSDHDALRSALRGKAGPHGDVRGAGDLSLEESNQ